MIRLTRCIPFLLIAFVLLAASPVAYGDNPPAPSPAPVEPERVACLPTGLALAVISQDGLVADILPALRPDAVADRTERIIVLPGPGKAGACAEFRGYWGPGAYGTAAVELLLFARQATDDAGNALGNPIAGDRFKDERRGPSSHEQPLRALAPFEKPGLYPLVAVLKVRAQRPATTSTQPEAQEDAIRVPFVVQVLDQPQPQPRGAIEGFVYNAQTGQPLGGAVVWAANKLPVSVSPPRDRAPILEPRPDAQDLDQATLPVEGAFRAVTDEKGRYRIELPPGRYIVAAAARGFAVQYYQGKDDPRNADLVPVTPRQTTGDINFKLRPLEEPQPPFTGVIRGQVVGQGAGPLAGARVAAQPVRSTDPGVKPLEVADDGPDPSLATAYTAVTDREGRYEIRVPAGKYVVMAKAEGYDPQWFKNADSADKATVVAITPEQPEANNVHFELKRTIAPPVSGVAGKVLRLTSAANAPQPVPGALVVVARRLTDPSSAVVKFEIVAKGQTDRQGLYSIPVKPGEYVVGVVLARAENLRESRIFWFKGTFKVEEATPVTVVEGAITGDIDFELPAMTTVP